MRVPGTMRTLVAMHMHAVAVLVMLVALLHAPVHARPEEDRVDSLPGLTDEAGADAAVLNMYSGYLDAGNGTMLHYWFAGCTAPGNPDERPLV